ncbi:hypothetical protein DID88_006695 [Monilinia fructigena]|uniref:Uncharacterized protein n=1 Tax=Monilinia fructigena TaxID=38457 RepID=A0A395IL80_9HELO|nr:hypothetical protein DID88_006695 [Monilinia fructigena]
MPRFVELPLNWPTHTKLDIKSLEQSVHGKEEAPEDCNCDLCNSEENFDSGWRCLANPRNTDLIIQNWAYPFALFPELVLKKEWDSKANKALSLFIEFTGDQPTDMSIILRQLPQYSSWTGIFELIIHSSTSRKEAPELYIERVQEIKALVLQINLSLRQLKLAAGLIDLRHKDWTLAYVDESDKRSVNDIHKKSSVFKKLEDIYWKDFADKLNIYKHV